MWEKEIIWLHYKKMKVESTKYFYNSFNVPYSKNLEYDYVIIYGSSGHGRFATQKYEQMNTDTLYNFSDPGATFTRELYNKEYELKDL